MLVEVKDSVRIAPLVGIVAVPVKGDGRAPGRIKNVERGVCAARPASQLRRGIDIGGETVAEDALDAGAAHANAHMAEHCLPMRLRLNGGGRGTLCMSDGAGRDDEQNRRK